ncbi:lytic murein transglycosylase B [Brackiella oedipodis]|uniref:lytic murein transglycosylase B n=1 Tax=Brackiella oedipodis TaxID=124225 RepID=UPI00057010F8|nr:lytic murein transglycosylase B [Brackiella oedipodis]
MLAFSKKLLPACLLSLSTVACSHSPHTTTTGTPVRTSSGTVPTTVRSAELEAQPLSAVPQQFVAQVAQRYQIPASTVQHILQSARYNPTTAKLMTPKAKTVVKRSWQAYRARFVEPIRLREGHKFWQQHQGTLAAAQQRYGVPAEIIVAIIGVETVYGRNTGSIRTLDALYTLGFHHPDSSRPDRHLSFRNQLAALMSLHQQGKLDAMSVTGSFAGAIGLPQFMPISILQYAVDGDGDGRIDLTDNATDAIFSVAKFLVDHGWQRQLPVFAPASLPSNAASLVDGGLTPSYTWSQLQAKGANSEVQGAAWQHGKVLGVIDLKEEGRGQTTYRLATQNFFAITQYNHSYFYATAVADLAQALKQRR